MYSGLRDDELVDAMRSGADEALLEFIKRFRPLLQHYAARSGLGRDDCDMLADDVIEDAALRFLSLPKAKLPRSIAAYLVVSFRNRLFNMQRSEARHEAPAADPAVYELALERDAALTSCSAATVRASLGPEHDDAPVSPVIVCLARALGNSLTLQERHLLVWVGEGVSQREIAHWLGITPAAARKRLERMRDRLRETARQHARVVSADDRIALQRFFRRCGPASPSTPASDVTTAPAATQEHRHVPSRP